jgi:hypothetical protein
MTGAKHSRLRELLFFASQRQTRHLSHDAVIRVYDDAGNVIETHQHAGEFKEW